MNIKKSTTELREEIKLNKWKNAKYKLLRNTKITGRILHLIYPLVIGVAATYIVAGIAMENFAFPFQEGTEKTETEYKYVKINDKEYKEDLGVSSSSDAGESYNAITINEKPELMKNGLYKVKKTTYKLEDDLSEKKLKAIRANINEGKKFDYDKEFGKPIELVDDVEKIEKNKKYISGKFTTYLEFTEYVKHENKLEAFIWMIGVGLAFWVVAGGFRMENYYGFKDRISTSIQNAESESGIKRKSKEIKKELKAREVELSKAKGDTFKEVSYDQAEIYSIREEYADEYEDYLRRKSIGYSGPKFNDHGKVIIKKENVYSSDDGSIISSSEIDVSTGREVKSGKGIILMNEDNLYETSEIYPEMPNASIQEMIDRYKNSKKNKKRISKALDEGEKSIGYIEEKEDLEDKALELIGINRTR